MSTQAFGRPDWACEKSMEAAKSQYLSQFEDYYCDDSRADPSIHVALSPYKAWDPNMNLRGLRKLRAVSRLCGSGICSGRTSRRPG